jgi:5-methylcytosine-specific restriction endonuclease McrA
VKRPGRPKTRSWLQRTTPLNRSRKLQQLNDNDGAVNEVAGAARPAWATRPTVRKTTPRIRSAVRKALYARTKGHCDKCGGPMLEEEMQAHHRRLRSQGGKDELACLLGCHGRCHNLDSDSIHLRPKAAYVNGWLVKSYQDPALTPVLIGGRSVLLGNDGSIVPIPMEGAA